MSYRSAEAQKLHSAVMTYIHHSDEPNSFITLQTCLSITPKDALTETGLHGHTHIHDAF